MKQLYYYKRYCARCQWEVALGFGVRGPNEVNGAEGCGLAPLCWPDRVVGASRRGHEV